MSPAPEAFVLLLDAAVTDDEPNMRYLIRRFPAMAKRAKDLTEVEEQSISSSPYTNHFYTSPGDVTMYGLVLEETPNARTLVKECNLDSLVYWGCNTDPVQVATIADIVDCMMKQTSNRPSRVLGLIEESHTDGTFDFNSETWIKPSALASWLSHAHWRGYKHARIVCHGASLMKEKRDEQNRVVEKPKVVYELMRDHGVGLCMDFAGSQGQAYGPGLYFGLSDHATVGLQRGQWLPCGFIHYGHRSHARCRRLATPEPEDAQLPAAQFR
jgi:hypothetical protein